MLLTEINFYAGMTLTSLAGSDSKTVTMLGSMLFLRCVSGARVITGADLKEVAGYKFEGRKYLYWQFLDLFTCLVILCYHEFVVDVFAI
jgi:hypothetical protein